MNDIGKNIKKLRTQKNMTQDTLAEKLFVTRQTVSNYETEKSRPDIDTLIAIAQILEVDLQEILYGPATDTARKKEWIRFAFAGGISLLLWLLTALAGYFAKKLYMHYVVSLGTIQSTLLYPAAFLLTGWTLMQLLRLFTRLRPIQGTTACWLRRGLLAFLAAVFLLVLPFYVLSIWNLVDYLIHMYQGGGAYSFHSPFGVSDLQFYLILALGDQPGILSLFGALLWLLGFPAQKG